VPVTPLVNGPRTVAIPGIDVGAVSAVLLAYAATNNPFAETLGVTDVDVTLGGAPAVPFLKL
jgi:hypothetical protein